VSQPLSIQAIIEKYRYQKLIRYKSVISIEATYLEIMPLIDRGHIFESTFERILVGIQPRRKLHPDSQIYEITPFFIKWRFEIALMSKNLENVLHCGFAPE
jgi:hypothetical protein